MDFYYWSIISGPVIFFCISLYFISTLGNEEEAKYYNSTITIYSYDKKSKLACTGKVASIAYSKEKYEENNRIVTNEFLESIQGLGLVFSDEIVRKIMDKENNRLFYSVIISKRESNCSSEPIYDVVTY